MKSLVCGLVLTTSFAFAGEVSCSNGECGYSLACCWGTKDFERFDRVETTEFRTYKFLKQNCHLEDDLFQRRIVVVCKDKSAHLQNRSGVYFGD